MGHFRIGIVGPGAVGQAIGRLLAQRGQSVVAVAGRAKSRAEEAAKFIGAHTVAVATPELASLADAVIVATSDEGITPVAVALANAGFRGVALHTFGARGPEALAPLTYVGAPCGVLHPLQTIINPAHGTEHLGGASFALAGDPAAIAWGREIIALLGGRELRVAPDRLATYHSGAVMASNGIVGLIDVALRLMGEAGLDRETAREALGPLARTALEGALQAGPEAALTGPIARGERDTVERHLDALAHVPTELNACYRAVGRCLLHLAERRGTPPARLRAIDRSLAAPRKEGRS